MSRIQRWLPWLVGLMTLGYLIPMCVRNYSWVFISSDSGDWLASALKWMVPQTTGAPIYILLSHLLNWLAPNQLAPALSICLAALPTAITVTFTYLSVKRLTKSDSIAFASSLALAGSAIVITQATTIGYHMLAVMFLIIAFYCYLREWRYRTALFLAFGLAVHILALPLALFWLLADRRLRMWFKPILLFVGVTAVFYSLILILMAMDTPRFLAGGLNIVALKGYFSATSKAIVGQMSIFETPGRIWLTVRLILMIMGAALIPFIYAWKKPVSKPTLVAIATVAFIFWYYFTCLDVMAWTHLSFATPFAMILAGVGLAKLHVRHTYVVLAYAFVVLALNPIFMNARLIDSWDPKGMDYMQQLEVLPKNSMVVANAGAQSLGIFYAINLDRPDLIPLINQYLDTPNNYLGPDYRKYLEKTWDPDIDYSNTLTAIDSALKLGHKVYYTDYYAELSATLKPCLNLAPGSFRSVRQVLSLTGLQPNPTVVIK